MNLWDDIYRPDQLDQRRPDPGFDQLNPIPGQIGSSGGSSYQDYLDALDEMRDKNKPAIPELSSKRIKEAPKTMMDRYALREEKPDPKTMTKRIDESRERREAPKTMMEKLMERDKERERIAKEEQRKLDLDRDTYNKHVAGSEREKEVVEDAGNNNNEEAKHEITEELENNYDLSTLKSEKEETSADIESLKEKVDILWDKVFP